MTALGEARSKQYDRQMAELPTPSEIATLASMLAPGLIISSIRVRAITGSAPDFKDRVLAYGVISTAYFAAVAPLFHVGWGPALPNWLWSFLQYFFCPVGLGLVSAYVYQWRASYRLAEFFGLHLAHHLPASWDYAFEGRNDQSFLLVTLSDGRQIAGRWARGSFASSSKDERDLLVAEMWHVGEEGQPWTPFDPPQSILLCGKDIKFIEFLGG